MYYDFNESPKLEMIDIRMVEQDLSNIYGQQLANFLSDKFDIFCNEKESLKSWIRGYAQFLDDKELTFFFNFGGLVLACFELPYFKMKHIEDINEDAINKFLSDCNKSKLHIKAQLKFAKSQGEDVHVVFNRMDSRQPNILIYLAEYIFLTPFNDMMTNKNNQLDIIIYLHFIINVLNDFYFDKNNGGAG